MMTPAQQEALDAYEQHGSYSKAAASLGISKAAFGERLDRARKAQAAPEGMLAAVEASGLDLSTAAHGWRVIQHDDGSRDSVFWKAPASAGSDVMEQIRAAFDGLEPAPVVPAPNHKAGDLLTTYLISDAHIGMYAWARETGEDYDTAKAVSRLTSWLGQAVAASPASERAVILSNGDLTHADDQNNETPTSKHKLDVDTRHFRTLDMTICALNTCVELALRKHKKVDLVVLPGNHDKTAYMAVLFAMAERWRDNPRVNVERNPSEFYVRTFGKVMIAAHHGDKSKAERLVLFLADEYPEMWGQTRFRYLFTGHLHHHKSADIGGCQWEQLRALTAKDAYAHSHAYSARAQLQSVTYHRDKGEVGRVKVGV